MHRQAYACFKIIKVPSCVHCNSILGNKIFETFGQRKAHVNKRLLVKFKRELAFLAWDKNELNELGRGLRARIKMGMENAQWASRRIWFSGVPTSADVPNEILRRVGLASSTRQRPSNAEFEASQEKGAA
jgi:hypothetical protein